MSSVAFLCFAVIVLAVLLELLTVSMSTEKEGEMAKFRKKAVVIEAVQLRWDTWSEMCDFAGVGPDHEHQPHGVFVDDDGNITDDGATGHMGLLIPTLEGNMLAREGDWIIRGVAGELYPCRPDIFEATYEPVANVREED